MPRIMQRATCVPHVPIISQKASFAGLWDEESRWKGEVALVLTTHVSYSTLVYFIITSSEVLVNS